MIAGETVTVPSEDAIETLVDTLRGFGRAYPTDMFRPLTAEEQKQMGPLLDRASAGMGRHCATFMAQAADMIDTLYSALLASQQASPAAPRQGHNSLFTQADIVAAAVEAEIGHRELALLQKDVNGSPEPTFAARVFVDALAGRLDKIDRPGGPALLPGVRMITRSEWDLGVAIGQAMQEHEQKEQKPKA